MKPTLLVIWHSSTGACQQLSAAIADGARSAAEVEVKLIHAREAEAAHALQADGLVFVSPEYLGGLAGLMKDFFDRSYYQLLEQVSAKPYALAVCAGSDGSGAVRQLERIALGLKLRAIAPALLVLTHAQTPAAILTYKTLSSDDLQRANELGATFAAGLSAGIY